LVRDKVVVVVVVRPLEVAVEDLMLEVVVVVEGEQGQ
jgi:hypothetical protein